MSKPQGETVQQPQTVTVSLDALALLIQQMQENQQKAFRELILEMRKPDPAELEKQEAQSRRAAEDRKKMIDIQIEQEKARNRYKEICPHKDEKGGSLIRGQGHSDGKVHPICIRCAKEFEPYPIPTDQMQYIAQAR